MTKITEASVLEVIPDGIRDLVRCRVSEWGTIEITVPTGSGVKVGEVRKLTITMTLGEVVGNEVQAQYR